jgi:C_GCAxxG_C_C family probable redox protein
LLAVCQHTGVETDLVPRVATAFGGGIGGTGSACGALVGAVMAIGLRHGRQQATERDSRAYTLTQDLRRRFEAEMGHVDCRDLTGMDLSTRQGVKDFYASDVPRRVCMPAVGTAYRLVMELLESPA